MYLLINIIHANLDENVFLHAVGKRLIVLCVFNARINNHHCIYNAIVSARIQSATCTHFLTIMLAIAVQLFNKLVHLIFRKVFGIQSEVFVLRSRKKQMHSLIHILSCLQHPCSRYRSTSYQEESAKSKKSKSSLHRRKLTLLLTLLAE